MTPGSGPSSPRPLRAAPGGRLLLAAAAAVVALISAGCGSSSSDRASEGETVAPRGAVYSYRVPQGFEQVDTIHSGDAHDAFSTALAAKGLHEGAGIVVGQIPSIPAIASEARLRKLLPYLERGIREKDRAAGAEASPVSATKVGDLQAIRWVTDATGSTAAPELQIESLMVFRSHGTGAIAVGCRWGEESGEAEMIHRGCSQLLDSLRVH